MMNGRIGVGYYFDGYDWTQLLSEGEHTLSEYWIAYTLDMWGRGPSDIYVVGEEGQIIHYDGESWKPMETGIDGDLRGVWGTEEAVYAVGDDDATLWPSERHPAIYRYDGEMWARVY